MPQSSASDGHKMKWTECTDKFIQSPRASQNVGNHLFIFAINGAD